MFDNYTGKITTYTFVNVKSIKWKQLLIYINNIFPNNNDINSNINRYNPYFHFRILMLLSYYFILSLLFLDY